MLADRKALATVPVKSLAKARPFYERTLGLELIETSEPGVQNYRAGDSTIVVYESAFAGTIQASAVTCPVGDDPQPAVRDSVCVPRTRAPRARNRDRAVRLLTVAFRAARTP